MLVDVYSGELAALMAGVSHATALFITAYNPFSVPQTDTENENANRLLYADLLRLSAHVIPGVGINPAGPWPPEPGFLALGLSLAAATEIGQLYRQNAVIWADRDAVPRLLLLR